MRLLSNSVSSMLGQVCAIVVMVAVAASSLRAAQNTTRPSQLPGDDAHLSLKEFVTLTDKEKAEHAYRYVTKLIAGVAKSNPDLAKDINQFFFLAPEQQAAGKYSVGATLLFAEIGKAERLAADGKLDLSQVEFEAVVQLVIRKRFPAFK